MRNWMKLAALAAVAGLLVACGGDDEPLSYTNDVKINPTKTRGSVVGQFQTWLGEPLGGVEVSVATDGKVRTATSGEDGRFTLKDLPAGSELIVRFAAEGYVSGHTRAFIENEAGDTPLNGALDVIGPIVLIPDDGRIEIEIQGKAGERLESPAASCTVDGTWGDRSWGGDYLQGTLFVEARFEDGLMVCDGIPNLGILARYGAAIDFRYAAIDVDGDGFPEYQGREGSVDPAEFVYKGMARFIEKAKAWEDEVTHLILASNVPALQGRHASSGTVDRKQGLEILFNAPVIVHEAKITPEFDTDALDFELEVSGSQVRLVPVGDWPAGQLFSVRLITAPRSRPNWFSIRTARFLTDADEAPTVTATFLDANSDGLLNPGESLLIEFSQVIINRANADDPIDLPYQIHFDLDSSGEIGDFDGESGSEAAYDEASYVLRHRNMAMAFVTEVTQDLPVGTDFVLRFDVLDWVFAGSAHGPLINEEMRVEIKIAPTP